MITKDFAQLERALELSFLTDNRTLFFKLLNMGQE